jgi:hypothetical protein
MDGVTSFEKTPRFLVIFMTASYWSIEIFWATSWCFKLVRIHLGTVVVTSRTALFERLCSKTSGKSLNTRDAFVLKTLATLDPIASAAIDYVTATAETLRAAVIR